jgi:hypothetical protein
MRFKLADVVMQISSCTSRVILRDSIQTLWSTRDPDAGISRSLVKSLESSSTRNLPSGRLTYNSS